MKKGNPKPSKKGTYMKNYVILSLISIVDLMVVTS